ncbi:GH18700 [Drosophila grimshawi]|uniref:non-specific serine/threonine protein kinase n=2 Tax=Drosophila grimshawi TaxID=7222 RepID=B4JGS4_DROGR|nr:GH18700 [Drosophila grimshawi]
MNSPKNARNKKIIGAKYQLIRMIAGGSFGDVYLGKNIESGVKVAIKIEKISEHNSQLLNEAKMYRIISAGIGFPRIHHRSTEKRYNMLVMDLLGPSLEDMFDYCKRQFTYKTVLMLADQMIARLHYIHMKGITHGDIKPNNFLMGIGQNIKKLFLVDFGLAKKFRDSPSGKHICYAEDKALTGTARYASIAAHQGIERSRRDDMESLGYTLIYFNRGSLPWQGLQTERNQQKAEQICEKKISTPIEVLCEGSPAEFSIYLNYCRSLRFEEQPNYTYLRELFQKLLRTLNHQYDYVYDWTLLQQMPKLETAPLLDHLKTCTNQDSGEEKEKSKPLNTEQTN